MEKISPIALSDCDLLAETGRVADAERNTTAQLIALLAEVDRRRLYLGQGYSSLFTYCTQVLHFSEHAAYERITAARLSRRLPAVFARLSDGSVTLTVVGLLAPLLNGDNCDRLLDAARHKSKRDVERLVASIDPQPDWPTSIRRLPTAPPPTLAAVSAREPTADAVLPLAIASDAVSASVLAPRTRVTAIAPAMSCAQRV